MLSTPWGDSPTDSAVGFFWAAREAGKPTQSTASAFNRIAAGWWTIKPGVADRLMDECAVAVRADLAPSYEVFRIR